MDNHTRRVGYVAQNRRCTREEAEAIVTRSYADGTSMALLRPGQRRRVVRSAGSDDSHFQRQRQARAERRARRTALWAPA